MSTFVVSTASILLLLSSVFSPSDGAEGARLDRVIADLKSDIHNETRRLNEVRKKIADERLDLADKVKSLEEEVSARRKKANGLRNLEQEHRTGFARLNEEINYLNEEIDFCSSISSEYRRDMGKRMSVAEEQRLEASSQT